LRMKSSVLGQIRHWVTCFSVTLPGGTGIFTPQPEQATSADCGPNSARDGWSQEGQRKVTFIVQL
jgi:hypothetical protein